MQDETIRTLITALSAVITTALTVWLAFRSLERKERIANLERELRNAYEEFTLLYKVEDALLEELAPLKNISSQQLKIVSRKSITEKSGNNISLTPERIKTKIKELNLK